MRRYVLAFLIVAACGSRTALLVTEMQDASMPVDASIDRTMRDGPREVSIDTLPPIDVVIQDVMKPLDCADAAITYIYLFSAAGDLLSFDPLTNKLKTIGVVACQSNLFPNSMAVDHNGIAYANYAGSSDAGQIFKLSTSTAACMGTAYMPQMGFTRFGMGFVADLDGGENLFIADTVNDPNGALAIVDINSYKLKYIASFNPALPRCELTGTGDGRLFAFCMNQVGSTLAQVDPKTAQAIGADTISVGGSQYAFAFAFWGGDFYLFTSANQNSGSVVTKWDPMLKKETFLFNTSQRIVGAGVSTCAPL